MTQTIKVGPFTWTRDINSKDECWDLNNAVKLIGMGWYCKNYGPAAYPGSSFSGWRCGSGGPWPTEYETREDAMTRVIPYLLERMAEELKTAEQKVEQLRSQIKKTRALIKNAKEVVSG